MAASAAPGTDPWISPLVSSSSDPIFACDLSGTVVAFNGAAEAAFGSTIHNNTSLRGSNLNNVFSDLFSSLPLPSPPPQAPTQSCNETNSIPPTHTSPRVTPTTTPSETTAVTTAATTAATAAATSSATVSIVTSTRITATTEVVAAAAISSSSSSISSPVNVPESRLRIAPSNVTSSPTVATETIIQHNSTLDGTKVQGAQTLAQGQRQGKVAQDHNDSGRNVAQPAIYPTSQQQVLALQPPLKRLVSRTTKDGQSRHFIESISLIHGSISASAPDPTTTSSVDSNRDQLVGYSVILTDLTMLLPSLGMLSQHSALAQQPAVQATQMTTTTTTTTATTATTPTTKTTAMVTPSTPPVLAQGSSLDLLLRPTATRLESVDSGFDERIAANSKMTTPPPPTSLASTPAPSSLGRLASVGEPLFSHTAMTTVSETHAAPTKTTMTTTSTTASSSSSLVLPPTSFSQGFATVLNPSDDTAASALVAAVQETFLSSSSSSTSSSLTSTFTDAASDQHTSLVSGTVSESGSGTDSDASPLSRESGHGQSLALLQPTAASMDPISCSSLTPDILRMEQEWRDPCFPFLAPIAATLLTCNGDSFFDVVVEELANSLGVKYAFVSQLVTLEELKDLDPPEYMSIVERFHGDIPPIDGVMHNISSWPGEPHIDPHAFQSYLTDCTIEDRITCVHSDLAHLHPDITEALSDPSVESYLSVRLETAQGEIVGVIGVIHSKPLDGESAMIVRRVLEHVGIRVADELDRLRMEANLVFARDTAESTAKNKTKFLADMSHEIRNPMNAVVGVTDILLDTEGLSDEQTGFIEVIRTSGQHLLTVINDILDISRIDQDVKFLLEKRPLSLRKCLKDAVSLAGLTPLHDVSKTIAVIEWPAELDDMQYCDHTGESTELPLLWTIDENVPEHLLGDITRLRQVLINLCTNSLKFTQRGRVSVRVSIHNPSQGNNPTIHPVSSPTAMRHFPTGSTVGTDHGHGLGQSQAQVLSHNHGQSHSLGHEIGEIGATRSWPASPMLTGQDHRQPMVFEQRYDVKIDSPTAPTPLKPVPSSRRRNGLGGESYGTHSRGRLSQSAPIPFPDAPEGYSSSTSSNTNSNTASPMIVAAPTANSMDKSKMDENTVILEFAVSDTGVGIPANKLADLFTSFSQVDISVSTRFGGTGLGLAISASLVEKMGGHIWVESTEGVGSRFTFTIPFAVCPSPDTESYPCSTAPSSPVTAPDSSEISSAPSIEPVQLPPVASRKSLRPTSSSFPSSLTSNGLTASPAPTPAPVPAPSSAPVSGPESGSKKDKKSKKETKGKKPLSIKSMGPRPTKESAVSKSLGPSYAKVVESNPVEPVTINDRPLRILLAEDNFVNQKVAVGVLKKLGYENVEVVDNGLRVIEKLDRGAVYDVILMDVSMPVMDGIDATKTIVNRRTRGLLYNSALAGGLPSESLEASGAASSSSGTERGHPAPPSIPTEGMVNSILPHPFQDYSNVYVIALTASAMGSDKERCILAGMDDFMTKPFAALEMKRVLAEFKSRLESGALQTRNEACLAAAVTAARNRCRSPTCQGNSSSGHSSEQEQNRAGTPLIPSALSSSSSTTSLVDIATGSSLPANGCQNCGGGAQENAGAETAGLSTGPISSGSPSLTAHRPSRLEAPWPIRKVDAASCGFIFGRRANSESVYAINGGATLDCSMNSAVFRRASENLCANGKWMDGAVVAGRGLGYQPSSITTVVVEDVQPEGRANVHPLESVLASLHMNKSLKSLKSDAETGLTSGAADVECKSTKPRSETEPSKDFGVTKGALLSPPPSASSATTSSSVLAASASLMSTNGTTTTKDLSAQGVNSEVVTMTAVPAATKSASLSSSSGSVSVSGPSSVSPPAAAAVAAATPTASSSAAAPGNGASSPVIPPPLTPPPNAMVYIKSIKRDLGMDNCMRFPTAL